MTANRVVFGRNAAEGPQLSFHSEQFPFHTLIAGESGGGKSALAEQMFCTAHEALSGPRIIVDGKGDGLPGNVLRTIAQRTGSLDNVLYFRGESVVPAVNPLDIRPALAAGVERERAVSNCIERYLELLRLVMGEGFDDAKRSPTILRYLAEALFDPVHGADVIAHGDLLETVQAVKYNGETPTVSTEPLATHMQELREYDPEYRNSILEGVLTRIEQVTQRFELRTMANHIARDGDAQFRFGELLDRDVTIVFDFQGVSESATQALTVTLLGELWRALQLRSARMTGSDEPTNVLLGIEETASIANTRLLSTLLAEGRGYGLSLIASMQYPKQVAEATDNDRLAHELTTEARAIIAGNVTSDPTLAKGLATPRRRPRRIEQYLTNLSSGEWLFTGPAAFDDQAVEPEVIHSPPLVDGRVGKLADRADQLESLNAAIDRCAERTAEKYGCRLETPTQTATSDTAPASEAVATVPQTTLRYTTRLPDAVRLPTDARAIVCDSCDNRYPATAAGLKDAVACHDSLAALDRELFPTVSAPLMLSAEELDATDLSRNQLLFLQVVQRAMRQAYSPLEYDIVHDSMRWLTLYCDVSTADVEALIDAGLLVNDDATKRSYYTVTSSGRELLNESNRQSVHHGAGRGDLGESATHIAMVEALRRYLIATYKQADDSPVARIEAYHDPDAVDGRLDVAGLDADGAVVVAGEAERPNHNAAESAPDDYHKMAALEPEDALWVVPSRPAGHKGVLQPLTNPASGAAVIERDPYSETTAMRDIAIDTPGFTDIFTFSRLQDELGGPTPPG
jgi:hypothetical protein